VKEQGRDYNDKLWRFVGVVMIVIILTLLTIYVSTSINKNLEYPGPSDSIWVWTDTSEYKVSILDTSWIIPDTIITYSDFINSDTIYVRRGHYIEWDTVARDHIEHYPGELQQ
jgi:hypothetical protein